MAWQDISTKAKEKLDASIPAEWRIKEDNLPPVDRKDVTGVPAECGILSDLELAITDSYATEIVQKVAAGEWKAEDVTRAFCRRAVIAHQLTNCLTVTMFDAALARAKELDDHLSRTGKTVGPLHGLPVSLKDNFNIPGYPSSVGFCSWALEPMEQESTIVAILRELGAVAYVKTNVPTAMMIAETVNNCYGRTTNPLNRNLTSGGSSGGESALIAMRGSPLGVGTDIGGSLRIPAACTGIYTIRPSYGRFPHFDARSGLAGQESIGSVHGPMARSMADLRLFTDNVANASPWLRDPKCIPMPWRSVEIKNRPKIAVLWDNGLCSPTPPVKRALQTVVDKLKSKNYDIITWPATGHAGANDLVGRFFVADGGRSVQKILEPTGEPWRPEMKSYSEAKELSTYDLWQLQKQRTALQKMYLDRWAACEGLDAILGPTTPYAAPRAGGFKTVSYTAIFNLLDYSSTSFPSGVVGDREVDVYTADFKALGEVDEVTKADYDAAEIEGIPVSLQLTCRRLEDEKVMALTAKVCEDIK
ncbi:uncharacterized protein LTR77_007043 [Saxophila tyrrhenica]|uniref:amidase n=1 Tax=Saxophila tyrrhenica TaxID=1690608 RepID=A0AAV9P6I9_9PEZI|nr:hypothetical protein LTR77_007043 [Saxophila tyrrhenica]